MPQFIFKLQAVLRQRKNIEQQRQRELVGVQRRLVAIEQQLRAVDNGVRAAEEDLRQNRLLGKLDLSFLAAHRRYSLAMRRKVLELAKVMAGAQKQVDEARARLVEAAKRPIMMR
jgi:flagellar export protein FliJ